MVFTLPVCLVNDVLWDFSPLIPSVVLCRSQAVVHCSSMFSLWYFILWFVFELLLGECSLCLVKKNNKKSTTDTSFFKMKEQPSCLSQLFLFSQPFLHILKDKKGGRGGIRTKVCDNERGKLSHLRQSGHLSLLLAPAYTPLKK